MKHNDVDLGIRAHPNMTVWKCLHSAFLFHQNEFIFIWLYFLFAVYFWYQVGLIGVHSPSYGFNNNDSYGYMLVVTIAIASTVTITLAYTLFYSISDRVRKVFEVINLNFQYFAAYIVAVIFLIADMYPKPVKVNDQVTIMDLFIYIVFSIYIIVVVLINFRGVWQKIGFWLTFITFTVILVIDFVCYS